MGNNETGQAKSTSGAKTTSSGKRRHRVLHVINGEHYAGAERVQDLLAMSLPEFGYEVGFACLKPGKFPFQRKATDTPLYQPKMKSKFDLRAARALADIAKIGGYDFLHAHTARSLLVARIAAKIANKPLVYHVHSPTVNDSTRWFTNRMNAWLERISLTGISQMICVSNSLVKHMETQGYNPALLNVVPNGVPCHGDLTPREPPKDKWILGTVALFRPRKGIEVLIDALSVLRSYGDDVRIRAVGPFETPEYEEKIKELARKRDVEDAIEWVGFSSDVNAELAKMDVMVLPSLFGEGLPMVIIEAMAAGIPVVGTDVQGVPEVLTEGNGLVANAGCAADLSNKVRALINGEEDWTSIRENAWQRQAEHFSDRSMARGVAAVYDKVVQNHEVADSSKVNFDTETPAAVS